MNIYCDNFAFNGFLCKVRINFHAFWHTAYDEWSDNDNSLENCLIKSFLNVPKYYTRLLWLLMLLLAMLVTVSSMALLVLLVFFFGMHMYNNPYKDIYLIYYKIIVRQYKLILLMF